MITVEFLPLYKGVEFPDYATDGSSGFDLVMHHVKKVFNVSNSAPTEYIDGEQDIVTLYPKGRALVGCGFKIALPPGFEVQVRPRSGLALKQGVTVLNSPGTIDDDYRGEIGVILFNSGNDSITFKRGDKVAQGVLQQVEKVLWKGVQQLSETTRGEGGFGSTDLQKPKHFGADGNFAVDSHDKAKYKPNQNY